MKDSISSNPPSWAVNPPTRAETMRKDSFDMRDAACRERGENPHPESVKVESVDEYMDRIMGAR